MPKPPDPGPTTPARPCQSETSALLPAILEVADVLIVVLDAEGRILQFNRACERLTGYRSDEVLRKRIWEVLIDAEELAGVTAVFDDLRAGRAPSTYDNYWLTKSGERRLVHWSNTVVESADGTVRQIVGTGIDITELHLAKEQLHEREARLEAVLETAVDGIITIDERGIIDSVNPAVERIFGYAAEELVGRNVSMLMPPPDCERHDAYIEDYLRTGERKIIGIGREVEGLRKDGTLVPLELAVSEVIFGDSRLFTGFLHDISERRRAEEEARRRLAELAHAERLATIGELASGMAHEVNQPLAAILNYAEVCLRTVRAGDADSEQLEDRLGRIVAQGQRAVGVIQHLRRLVRKGEPAHGAVDVNRALRDVLALLEHEIDATGIAVALELDQSLLPVEADRVQLEQVVLNLIHNAVEAMEGKPPAERRLRLRTRPVAGGGVQVTVEDSGDGLPPEEANRVFERFFTTKSAGLGMGLAISRSIVEAHGGRLWADTPGEGAAFHFTLPEPGAA